ncbi:MAG: hypothetical protein JSS27_15720 [Planctomycetes bacterium]|nr:hypothetical protein [Planctomycetota bacterium]
MARNFAGLLGLVALATTLVRALGHGTAIDAALVQGWINLMLFSALGLVLGWIAQRAVQEGVRGQLAAELASQQTAGGAKPNRK